MSRLSAPFTLRDDDPADDTRPSWADLWASLPPASAADDRPAPTAAADAGDLIELPTDDETT